MSGLGGVYYGFIVRPELPEYWLILFAAMIGLPEFIKGKKDD